MHATYQFLTIQNLLNELMRFFFKIIKIKINFFTQIFLNELNQRKKNKRNILDVFMEKV